ncbi:hypothetical protein Nmel_008569, partial [Mimus melanotis]
MDSGTPDWALLWLCPSFEWLISPLEAAQHLRRGP